MEFDPKGEEEEKNNTWTIIRRKVGVGVGVLVGREIR